MVVMVVLVVVVSVVVVMMVFPVATVGDTSNHFGIVVGTAVKNRTMDEQQSGQLHKTTKRA